MKNKVKVKSRKVVFSKGPIHLVDCMVQMPDGSVLSRQILEHPGAVVIIPKTGKNRFLLIRQYRFAARSWLWEWPAGGIEHGESLRTAASRELCEEAGFRPKRLKKIVSFYPTPGVSAEVMHIFLAEALYRDTAPKDDDEDIEVKEFTLLQIERMVKRGMICDGKTLLGLAYLKNLI